PAHHGRVDGGPDPPLQARHRRHPCSGGTGLHRRRIATRRTRRPHGQRRRHTPVPRALPRPVVHESAGRRGDVRGRHGLRRDRRRRQHRPGDGGSGPMSTEFVRAAGSETAGTAATSETTAAVPMTEPAGREPVLVPLGPRPDEDTYLTPPDAPRRYPDDVRARLDADADRIVARYPQPRSALLPLLHLVQAEDGYITPAGIEFCARRLGLTGAEVAAVSTFYTMYRRSPTGRHHVGVCTNALCATMGGDEIFGALREHLDVGHDETTADGAITLEHIECNAACDYAPVMTVDWELFDNRTVDSAIELVDDLLAGGTPTPTRGAPLRSFRDTARLLA